MKSTTITLLLAAAIAFGLPAPVVLAQAPAAGQAQQPSNRIEGLHVAEQGGTLFVRVTLSAPLANPPGSFSIANPARIAFDFPDTGNALGRTQQNIGLGDLRSANIVQAGDRTRLVLNMTRVAPYETRLEGRDVIIALSPAASVAAAPAPEAETVTSFATAPRPELGAGVKSVQDIKFRRGADGEGRVLVQLSSPDTGIDIRRQGPNLVVEFLGASLPEHLQRRSDVTDFGTPITTMTAQPVGANVRLTVTPHGMWEHNAYQSDNQFVLEVRRVVEDPTRLVQGARPGEYAGEKLSLNFQNVDIRSVLQVIADFTDFNIVTSDSVQGNLTLRLKDVPWDQALDIILQAKGLDMRKTGNVIWIAPADELAARERQQLEALAAVGDLEPLQTESFQINYHRASEIFEFLKTREQTLLSPRGSVVFDERSNKLFVTDVALRLDDVRRLVTEIDIAPRQVSIEARVVEANKDFARDLGVRLGIGGVGGRTVGFDADGRAIRRATVGGGLGSTAANAGQLLDISDLNPGGLNLNLPAPAGSGALSMVLWNNAATRFLNLELSALESDGRGRIVSSPRVLTANQVEAVIEQGTEIPYRKETSSGATSVEFKKAVLALKVKPQITPDGRIQLKVEVNKDRPEFLPGFAEPAINTKNVSTEVLVDNGGTIVIGGIYEEEDTDAVARIPVLGEVPVVGALFRNTKKVSNRKELLVFITPRIVADSLTLR